MKPTAAVSLLLLAAGCDRATEPAFDHWPEESMHTIAWLKTLCAGRSSAAVTQDVTVRGTVVANDLYGEFERTIVVEDTSGGISIALNASRLSDRYPFGALVTVRCNGLTLCDYGGKIQLGAAAGPYGAEGIPETDFPRYLHIARPPEEGLPQAAPLTFADVTPDCIDTRVRFDGVRFLDEGQRWCDIDPATGRTATTERTIVDARGDRFLVRTLAGCLYAKEPVPAGTGSLYGVIDCFNGKYTLRVTHREAEFTTAAAPPTAYP